MIHNAIEEQDFNCLDKIANKREQDVKFEPLQSDYLVEFNKMRKLEQEIELKRQESDGKNAAVRRFSVIQPPSGLGENEMVKNEVETDLKQRFNKQLTLIKESQDLEDPTASEIQDFEFVRSE